MALFTKTLKVQSYDDFRDQVPSSGIFEMTDCAVEFWCPEDSDTSEIERMVKLLESMVHVTDVRVGSAIEDLASNDYRIVITEVPSDNSKRFSRER